MVASVTLSLALGLTFWLVLSPARPPEVAVLFTSTDVAAWPNFVEAVRLASAEKGWAAEEEASAHRITVQTESTPIRFQWYPVIGSAGVERQVRELCQRERPPIAIIGSNNTSLTETIGNEIRATSKPEWTPLLLMTQATADGLIDLNPGRTFRFGHANSYQARAVVASTAKAFGVDTTPVSTKYMVVQVLDNPFSIDLARQFQTILQTDETMEPVASGSGFADPAHADVWSLATATGTLGMPTARERDLARAVVEQLIADPELRLVLVMTFGGSTFGNVAASITEAARASGASLEARDGSPRIVMLTGDSIDYYDFVSPDDRLISPSKLPGPIVFFSHVDPVDATVPATPAERTPAIALDRDVVRSLLATLPELADDATPDQLAEKLNASSFFATHERAAGGAAVIVKRAVGTSQFTFDFPNGWGKGWGEALRNGGTK